MRFKLSILEIYLDYLKSLFKLIANKNHRFYLLFSYVLIQFNVLKL